MKELGFNPIPCRKGGKVCLSIRPPGTWFDNADFIIFVGGCGHGTARTLGEAKTLLLEHAKQYCVGVIKDAEEEIKYYQKQLKKLEEDGLVKE